MMPIDPVQWPQPVALAIGGLMFALSPLIALARSERAGERGSTKALSSWIGIAVQALGIGVVAFGPFAIIPPPVKAESWLIAAAVLLMMLSATFIFVSAKRTMGRNWSLTARTRGDHELVTGGLFGVVRHPIYVALFLFMTAFAFASGHWRMLAIGIPLYAVGTWLRIREEERLLRDAFGDEYATYARRVRRFLPGVF